MSGFFRISVRLKALLSLSRKVFAKGIRRLGATPPSWPQVLNATRVEELFYVDEVRDEVTLVFKGTPRLTQRVENNIEAMFKLGY